MLEEKKKDRFWHIKQYRFSDWAWLINLTSFMGFVVEDIWLLFKRGYINNRNM